MEKIYLVESELVVGCEYLRSACAAYKSYMSAKRLFEREKADYVNDMVVKRGWLQTCGSETSFDCFEEGYYSENHATVTIREIELLD